MASLADHIHHGVYTFLTKLFGGSFHHDPDHRLCAGFSDQDPAGITQTVCHGGNCLLNLGIVLGFGFGVDPYILQHLGIDRQTLAKLTQGLFLCQHDFHHLQAGEDAVAGGSILADNDMAALLAANDHYAIQVLSICRARAIKVPRQISILGVDNDELLAENAVPSLSSIEPDFNEAGFCAAAEMDRLLRARKNPSGRKIICGVKRLVERHSTTYLAPSAQLVANALAFIRRHAADGITPNDIARNLKVSRSLIELRMREVHGKSLAATLRERRLQLVKDLLRQTDRPIAKILSDCGYRNIRSAENIFTKTFGVSPRAWRQKA